MKRRHFLIGTVAAAGALVVGCSVLPPRQRLVTGKPIPLKPGEVGLNGWVKVAPDNSVTVMMARSEMGQGAHTGMAMLLAEELDADWAQVRVEHSNIDGIYNNVAVLVDGLAFHPDDDGAMKRFAGWMVAKIGRDFGTMITGGSSSIKDVWEPMRVAGASARAMLVNAAAAQWNVPASECRVEAGKVLHASGRAATFGELAALAGAQPLPGKVALKDPAKFRLIGQPLRRIEAPSKLDGTARFGIDVVPEGMVYASIVQCPTLGGTVASFDAAAAMKVPGVTKVIKVDAYNGGSGGVAAIADTPWHALRAVKEVTVQWDHGVAAGLSSQDVERRLKEALDRSTGHAYFKRGDVDAALAGAAKVIGAEYRAPFLAHAAMEPMNCTVQLKGGAATVWVSTQMPGLARDQVAKVLKIPADNVDVKVQMLGGGFGRRLEADFISQAAAIARETAGAPVQLLWSREQDTTHDYYRPACVSRFSAGLDGAGNLVAWNNVSSSPAIIPKVLKRNFGYPSLGNDKTTAEGAFDQPYEWPAARIGHEVVDVAVPVGFWRAVGHSHQAFFKECFLDEVAVAAGKDPVEFRAALLAKHPRHLAVLRRAAEVAGWKSPSSPAPDGAKTARGIALHQCFGSVVAQVAQVSLAADKTIRVHRVTCVIDCGTPVNPNLIRQQMESGIVFGLSAALFGEITIVNGQVQQTNYHDFPVLRMNECPAIETVIMPSQATPEGVGEPGTPPIAPAVANAVFALTGQRLRSLPLKPA